MRIPGEVQVYLRDHHGVVPIGVCRDAGMSNSQISARIRRGEWERVHRGVYRVAGVPLSPEAALAAACAAVGAGAVVSHRSAAWLWGLRAEAPRVPEVSVGPARDVRLAGLCVHRMNDLDLLRCRIRRGLECTDPLRTVVDLAGQVEPTELDDTIDRALAARLLDVDGLLAETLRLARRGRAGVSELRRALLRRGITGSPHPSVLESRLLRLFHRAGIVPVATEVVVYPGGGASYRLDVLLAPRLAVEVDGFRYHSSPRQKTRDERRRNAIRLSGTFLLVYSWWDVVDDPKRVVGEVRRALGAHQQRPSA